VQSPAGASKRALIARALDRKVPRGHPPRPAGTPPRARLIPNPDHPQDHRGVRTTARRYEARSLNLDRLGRSLRHLIDVIAGLQQREIAFQSLRENIDTTTATGRLQLHLFAALAEFEREVIRERSAAGRDAARARGRQGGRPSVITLEPLAGATATRDKRELTMTQIARALKVGRSTLYKHLDLSQQTSGEDELAA
jgi:hypothetical protein